MQCREVGRLGTANVVDVGRWAARRSPAGLLGVVIYDKSEGTRRTEAGGGGECFARSSGEKPCVQECRPLLHSQEPTIRRARLEIPKPMSLIQCKQQGIAGRRVGHSVSSSENIKIMKY